MITEEMYEAATQAMREQYRLGNAAVMKEREFLTAVLTAVLGAAVASHYADEPEPIHQWFGLTYANYLVIPRSVLQSMPREWQAQFCELLDEARASFGYLDWPRYAVNARNPDGKFGKDPIPHYDRGRTQLSLGSS